MPPVLRRRPLYFSVYSVITVGLAILAAAFYRMPSYSREDQAVTPMGPLTLSQAVARTIVLNPLYRGSLEDYGCHQLIKVVDAAIEQLDSAKRNLELAVTHGLSIVCDPKEMPQKNTFTASHILGKVHMVPGVLDASPEVLSHEVAHFLAYVRHTTQQCNMPAGFASFPLYLDMDVTSQDGDNIHFSISHEAQQRVDALSKSLDRGDARVAHFKAIWERSQAGTKLSESDREVFQTYRKAAKKSLLRPAPNHYLKTKTVNTEAYLFAALLEALPKALREHYKGRSEIDLIVERFELIMQILSLSARDLFYSEAMALIRADERKCPLPEPSSGTPTIH